MPDMLVGHALEAYLEPHDDASWSSGLVCTCALPEMMGLVDQHLVPLWISDLLIYDPKRSDNSQLVRITGDLSPSLACGLEMMAMSSQQILKCRNAL